MHKNTHRMHKNGGYVSSFKARRDDNNVDVLWSGDRMRRVDPRCCGLCVGMDALNDYRLIVFNN